MEHQELWASLERIYVMDPRERYMNDEIDRLHHRCVRDAEEMSHTEIRVSLSRFIRDVMLSEDALTQDNGWEEVLSFLDWIDGGME